MSNKADKKHFSGLEKIVAGFKVPVNLCELPLVRVEDRPNSDLQQILNATFSLSISMTQR